MPIYYDISVPLHNKTVCWRDCACIQVTERPPDSDNAIVSGLKLTTHTGTHIDAPKHFVSDGGSVDEIDPKKLLGPCIVHEIAHTGHITEDDINSLPEGVLRVIFKTANTKSNLLDDPNFHMEFVTLTPESAQAMIERGIVFVGVDYLSVEPPGTPGHPVHRLLLKEDIVILEGCYLKDITPGAYHLHALPLRIRGGDGSPARAILTTKE